MRPTQYSTATLIDLFHRHTVASLPEVMAALGTRARRTAFRKLKELPYRTSYSHRGGYYTLEELIDFDQHGLWSFRAVRFSAAGTLLATTAAMVSDAPAGQFSEELDNLLHVGTQDVLRKLVQQRKLSRQKVAGQFLYCAADRTRKAQQLSARRALLAAPGLVGPVPDADLMPDQLRAAIVLFASLLDERQRRLYAGLESLKCGWGGDARIAGLLGIDPGTVARGRKQAAGRAGRAARRPPCSGSTPPASAPPPATSPVAAPSPARPSRRIAPRRRAPAPLAGSFQLLQGLRGALGGAGAYPAGQRAAAAAQPRVEQVGERGGTRFFITRVGH